MIGQKVVASALSMPALMSPGHCFRQPPTVLAVAEKVDVVGLSSLRQVT